jgi:hypothetical protein
MAASLSDIVTQNTVGQSEGFPVGVPTSYDWYHGVYKPNSAPPSDFTSVTAWGQVYREAGSSAYYNPNATVEVANARTYVHLRSTGEWVLVQDQAKTGIAGGHFVTDFSGNNAIQMKVTNLSGGTVALAAPPAGYNDHFWPTSRGVYPAGAIDGVYVQMDMRVNDPNLHLVANIGADWWRSSSAPFVDGFGNNPGAGMSNWVDLSTQWTTLGFYSTSTAQFQADLPPTLTGSTTPPPVGTTPDTVAPSAPTITGFTPDTGTVGDRITTASTLTLSGTAEAGSTVKLFDGSTSIGTAKANANGTWSVATAQLSAGTHSFTARATDVAGNTSTASSLLSIRVDATTAPPTGSNLLVNGSFEASSVAANNWAGFSSIPGWTALSGGTIELWNNLNNVRATNGANFGELDYLGARDGLYQSVRTTAGQSYDLSFDARSRPGVSSSTTTIEVLWNDSVVATVPPGSAWRNYHFNVVGTGGQDRLTFREAANQSADGLGALYDNVSLVPVRSVSTSTVPQSTVAESTQAMNLMTQYSATSFPTVGAGTIGGPSQNDTSAALAQTLAAKQSSYV